MIIKTSISVLTFSLTLAWAVNTLAATIHPAPKKLSDRRIMFFLEEKRVFQNSSITLIFKPNGDLSGTGPEGQEIIGTWKVKKNSIIIKGKSKSDDEENPIKNIEITWKGIQITKTGVMIVDSGTEGGLLYECGKRKGNEEMGRPGCIQSAGIQLVSAGKKKTYQYKQVLKKLQHADVSHGLLLIEGAPQRNNKKAPQILFAKGQKDTASFFAQMLKPILGKVTQKSQTTLGAYDLILIINK